MSATDTESYDHSPQPATMCCAYLCTFCPRKSFPSLELLEEHLGKEHCSGAPPAEEEQRPSMLLDCCAALTAPPSLVASSGSPPQMHSPTSSSSVSSNNIPNDSDVQQQPLTCKKCPGGRTFPSSEVLSVHYANTHKERPQYVCEQCGATFSIKRELATHNRTHSGEQPHQCVQCGKEFGTRQLLKKHNMWHTGERSHVCPHCAKAFFQKGHLTQHLMIHRKERPHQCSLCDKTFIFKFDLNRHLKIHKERAFACRQCAKCFPAQNALEEHAAKCKWHAVAVKRSARSDIRSNNDNNNNNNNGSCQVPEQIREEDEEMKELVVDGEDDTCGETVFQQQQQPQCAELPPVSPADQRQLALGRAFSHLLAAQQASSQQCAFPCLFCPQKFPSQAAYLLHWSVAHMRPGADETASAQQPPLFKPLHIVPQHFAPNEALAPEDHRQLLLGLQQRSGNTSCTSSPQKASPMCTSSSVPAPFCAPSAAALYSCPNCDLALRRAAECGRELAETRAELERVRALLLRFGAIFGLNSVPLAGQQSPPPAHFPAPQFGGFLGPVN